MVFSRLAFEVYSRFDEAYRDTVFGVYLCLKPRDQGYRNLFTLYACFRSGNKKAFLLDYGREGEVYPAGTETFRIA